MIIVSVVIVSGKVWNSDGNHFDTLWNKSFTYIAKALSRVKKCYYARNNMSVGTEVVAWMNNDFH